MDCPRCGGSVETYTLGGREARSCVRCGWVGINTTLQRQRDVSRPSSLDDVTDDISTESATVDRRDPITLPTETSPTDGTASDPENEFESDTPSMISDTDMDADDVPAQTLLAIGTISQSEATALAAAGIDTIDALATIEPIEVTAEIDLSVERLQTLSDRAAIHLVTNDASDE